MMSQLFRLSALVLFLLASTPVFASDEVDRFAKKCDLFHGQKDFFEDPKKYYREQAITLKRAAVPIRLSFDTCKLEYIIQLKNGSTTVVEHSYPTNADPDNKATSNHWNAKSPSKKYWYFKSGGWEWGGFVLVNKFSGEQVTEIDDCAYHQMQMKGSLLAIICQGSYGNVAPTLYIVDLSKPNSRWSKPIELFGCEERASFKAKQFSFIGYSSVRVAGECSLTHTRWSKKQSIKSRHTREFSWVVRTSVKPFTVKVTPQQLEVYSQRLKSNVEWEPEKKSLE